MEKNYIDKFGRIMRNAKDKEYMFNILTYSIAPTLLGIKCGTIISLAKGNRGINKTWKKYGGEFLDYAKINCFELNCQEEAYLLLFYDEKLLSELILKPEYRAYLAFIGYKDSNNLNDYLNELKVRFSSGIPHEMGLFLGISLEDVIGFINNNGRNYLHCGYWKVYSNLEFTLNIFRQYSLIKNKVIQLLAEGADAAHILNWKTLLF